MPCDWSSCHKLCTGRVFSPCEPSRVACKVTAEVTFCHHTSPENVLISPIHQNFLICRALGGRKARRMKEGSDRLKKGRWTKDRAANRAEVGEGRPVQQIQFKVFLQKLLPWNWYHGNQICTFLGATGNDPFTKCYSLDQNHKMWWMGRHPTLRFQTVSAWAAGEQSSPHGALVCIWEHRLKLPLANQAMLLQFVSPLKRPLTNLTGEPGHFWMAGLMAN